VVVVVVVVVVMMMMMMMMMMMIKFQFPPRRTYVASPWAISFGTRYVIEH